MTVQPHPFLHRIEGFSSRVFLILPDGTQSTFADLMQEVKHSLALAERIKTDWVSIRAGNLLHFLAQAIAAEYCGKKAVLFHASLSDQDWEKISRQLPASCSSFPASERPKENTDRFLFAAYQPGKIVLTTSGSTGSPKAIIHRWESLLQSVSLIDDGRSVCWLLTYQPASFAGLQVILHALMNGSTLLVASPESDLASLVSLAKITHISATPSWWRKFLIQTSPAPCLPHLQQITLGGEPITQHLLDTLSSLFPHVPITQIYASTEMGACFTVKDKKAGLPLDIFAKGKDIEAKLGEDGELMIRSHRRMEGYAGPDQTPKADGWYATGDVMIRSEDRLLFGGRKQEIINVGGFKVYPAEVEAIIERVPGVLHVRVYGEPSSILGQIVMAEIEAAPGADSKAVEAAIQAICAEKLPRPKIPRRIFFTHQPLSANSKVRRTL